MAATTPLQNGTYYHIYNRGNNRENLFVEARNYTYFLKRYAHYITPVADTFAYCLLRNHFHLLVRIHTQIDPAAAPGQAFSNLFNAYARAFNRTYNRTGALFQRPFGRIAVTAERYFAQLVIYIHRNPQKHGFVTDFRTWPYSSYHTLLSHKPSRLQRDTVLEWFHGPEACITAHAGDIDFQHLAPLVPEDFD